LPAALIIGFTSEEYVVEEDVELFEVCIAPFNAASNTEFSVSLQVSAMPNTAGIQSNAP